MFFDRSRQHINAPSKHSYFRRLGNMDAHKNPDLETTHNHHHHRRPTVPPPSSHDFKVFIKNLEGSSDDYGVIMKETNLLAAGEDHERCLQPEKRVVVVVEESSGRERLKRHRVEMAGRVWIPDIWGQEDLLKNWIDCTVFDSSLKKSSIMSAREALIQEAQRSTLSC